MIDTLKTWLQTFPGWPDAPFLTDTTEPDCLGIFSRGLQVVSDRVDILGRHQARYRLSLELGRVCPQTQEAAAWLLRLQNWAQEQTGGGLPDLPGKGNAAFPQGLGQRSLHRPTDGGIYQNL